MIDRKDCIIYCVLFIVIAILGYNVYSLNKKTINNVTKIEKVEKDQGVNTIIFYDQMIESLKAENRLLYDSIKNFKKQVNYLAQFKYKKHYKLDTVYIDTTSHDKIIDYKYSGSQNDSLNYNLLIGSTKEPNYYKLDVTVSDKFTIINKENGLINQTDIKSDNKGDFDDVTVFNKKKRNFFDRISVGPSIGITYDPFHKNFETTIGFAVTFDVLKR